MERGPDAAMEHEHTAGDHEHDEREVEDENRVGRKARDHASKVRKPVRSVLSALALAAVFQPRGELGERAVGGTGPMIAFDSPNSRRGLELA